MRVPIVLMGIALAAGGCAGSPATRPSPSPAPPDSVVVPWHLVSSGRDSAKVTIRYQISGCFRTPRIAASETGAAVSIQVTLLSTAKPGEDCPADAVDRTSIVTLSQPLGARPLRH